MENDTIQTEVISPIVLHTAVETGIQFVREDYKKRSAVKVKNGRKTVCVYHMNNIPFFQNDYLSWENLNCCGGWKFDDKELLKFKLNIWKKYKVRIIRIIIVITAVLL